MISPQFHLVVAVVYEDQVEPGLARSALRNKWPILDARSIAPIAKHVLLAQPRVVLIQVPPTVQPATGLLTRLSRHWNPLRTVAVTSVHAADCEMLVRQSGADVFVPGPCSPDHLEQVVQGLCPDLFDPAPRPTGRAERCPLFHARRAQTLRTAREM